MSESWERENKSLKEIINIDGYEIISNTSQRKGCGGRPAIFANTKKFEVKDLKSVVHVPWGVEAVWCLLTSKDRIPNSKVKRIALCALYCKPDSKKKTLLLDHMSEAYNVLCKKYGSDLDFICAGDTNHLKLDSILSLDSRFTQVVKEWTRNNPPAILDPVMMTLSHYYQEPNYLEPLDADPDKIGVKSDHRIIICRPINQINEQTVKLSRQIKFRPFTSAGFDKMSVWIKDQNWSEVYECVSAHEKAEVFQKILVDKLNDFFPEKTRTVRDNDQPWINHKLKQLDRRRKRIYNKEKKSIKWKSADKQFREECKSAKRMFYKKSVEDLKLKQPRQWYSCLKKISSYDRKGDFPYVEEISDFSDQDQAEKIADRFAKIQNEYSPLQNEDINFPPFSEKEIPFFSATQIWFALTKLNPNKSTVPGDFPAKLSKHFAAYLAEPLADIINTSVRRGEYPKIYKFEQCTPVPKVYPTLKTSQLRNISGLFHFDKIFEKLLAQLIISDMEPNLDPSQYGNQQKTSIQHYLVKLVHKILVVLDKYDSRKEINAVLVNMIDWDNAFPRQCPKLGIQSFIKNGVRASLIPVLVNFFQDRTMSVRWHGKNSIPRKINGGGPQGATLGLLEYISQSNDCAFFVPETERFRFVDDLSILEIINLLTVGLASYNSKQHIPSHIPEHNMFIPAENLKSQKFLEQINEWTQSKQMKVNEKKTKNMIFNFSKDHQFSTQLKLNGETIETVSSARLLGTILSSNLKWDQNIEDIVKRANGRMQLLRKVAAFNPPIEDLKTIYILFIRSLLEQSAVVWHSSITEENSYDLERVQRSALKVILGEKYVGYKKSLEILNLQLLKDRRSELCLRFAKKSLKHPKHKEMFPLNKKVHNAVTRNPEKFKVEFARTERLKK